jgi:uncharacterized protein (DUF433 family)
MNTKAIEIVDGGRGPQLSTTRITVLDIFYYLHRGYSFDAIQQIMPTLSRVEFDVVLQYVKTHEDELAEKDRQAEEFIQRGIEQQKSAGSSHEIDDTVPLEERVSRLKKKMLERLEGKNGEGRQFLP